MDVQVKEEKCDIISHNDINPWNVSDASVFLKYSCPECEFQSKGLDTFGEHAIANHHRSSVLFKPEQTELKSELQDVSDYIDEDDYMLVEPKVKIDLANTEQEKSSILPVVTPVFERPLSSTINVEGDVFVCKKCPGQSYESKLQAVKHLLEVHLDEDKEYEVCQVCIALFKNKRQLKDHQAKVHPELPTLNYKCDSSDKCDIDTDVISTMQNHYKDYHGGAIFNGHLCDKCDKAFFIYEELLEHQSVTHNEHKVLYKCDHCPMSYRSKKLYLCHSYMHDLDPNKLKLVCEYCDIICDTELQMYEHYFQYHIKKKPLYYKCNHCDYVTDTSVQVNNHSLQVHGEEHRFPCSKCPTTRKTWDGLYSHVTQMHNANGDTVCEHCAKRFTNRPALARHIKDMHNTDNMYVCETCGFSTNSKNKLYNHNRNTHLTDKMKTCPHCGKQFPHSTKLEVHIDRIHSDSGPKNYACDKCEKTFIYERSLKEHKYSCTNQVWVHEQRKREKMGLTKKVTFHKPKGKPVTNTKRMEPTKCDYCDVVFERRAQICRHYKDFHPGKPILLENIELFKCDECDAVYTQGMALNIHVIKAHGKRTAHKKFCEDCKLEYVDVHKCRKDNESGSGTFPCKFCGQIFRWRASMFRHEKNIHGEERFSCDICHKKFVTSSQLSHHTKYSHTPVNCDVCGKTIRSEYDLKRHKAFMHHDDSAWFCPTCPKKKVFFSKEQFDRHMAKSHTILS